MAAPPLNVIQMHSQQADINRDGKLDFNEWQMLLSYIGGLQSFNPIAKEQKFKFYGTCSYLQNVFVLTI